MLLYVSDIIQALYTYTTHMLTCVINIPFTDEENKAWKIFLTRLDCYPAFQDHVPYLFYHMCGLINDALGIDKNKKN